MRRTYRHGPYREFIVTDSKKRVIKAAPFRDRVVHHAVVNIIEPIFEKAFIFDSYACRRGKGTHRAIKRLEHFIRSLQSRCAVAVEQCGGGYCLKCDISKYFDSIDHGVLFRILAKRIGDENVLWLLREIIESSDKGIPIGNLTSQLFANVYLHELDWFVKRTLREHYYLRYMDDFVILGADKRHLDNVREVVRAFLRDELKLTLHPKKSDIFPIETGVDFLGYVLRDGKRFVRKSTVKRMIKKRRYYEQLVRKGTMSEERLQSALTSWRGYMRFAHAYGLMKKLGFMGEGEKLKISSSAQATNSTHAIS